MIAHLSIYLLVCTVTSFKNVDADCSISISTDLKDPQPLYLKPDNTLTGNNAFIQPIDNLGTIVFRQNEQLTISCPGSKISLQGVSTSQTISTATCVRGKDFFIQGKTVKFEDIVCSKQPVQVLGYTGYLCGGHSGNTGREVVMGFNLDSTRFYTQIKVCFDPIARAAHYAISEITASIRGSQSNYPRVPFAEGGFYRLDAKVEDLYKRETQRATINKKLGLNPNDYKYIHASGEYYLARGHLAAKTDFVFGSQQRLTFNFINAAPQWQTLNNGNWKRLENSVKDLAITKDLQIYTGTLGTLKLPNGNTGIDEPIYLYEDSFSASSAIPVPEYFWKVVYHIPSKSGVAFVAVNNPLATYAPFCTDICHQISWFTWNQNAKSGFGYCCEVDDFRTRAAGILPPFQVLSILRN